jgi:hypothetical protein
MLPRLQFTMLSWLPRSKYTAVPPIRSKLQLANTIALLPLKCMSIVCSVYEYGTEYGTYSR